MRSTSPLFLLALTAALSTSACKKPQIKVYEVPKEKLAAARPLPGEGQPTANPATAAGKGTTVVWNVTPEGWLEEPAGGMRKGTFKITASEGTELAITAFPGDVGGLLANINRWRGQVSLAQIDESQLQPAVQSIEIEGRPAQLVDLVGETSRILGVILPLPATTWFFKLSGPPEAVEAERERLQEFLSGLHVHDSSHNHGAPTQPAAAQPSQPVPNQPSPSKAKDSGVSFEMPSHWQQKEASAMRIASFTIPGKNDGKADLSIVSLGPQAGSVLANVNRWRGQLGLGPTTQADIDATVEKVPVEGGDFLTILIEAQPSSTTSSDAPQQAILAAIMPRGQHTWFVKMTGDITTVRTEHPLFKEFLKRLTLP